MINKTSEDKPSEGVLTRYFIRKVQTCTGTALQRRHPAHSIGPDDAFQMFLEITFGRIGGL